MRTTTIAVKGLSCSGCVTSVSKALHSVEGVQNLDINLAENLATVTFDESLVQENHIKNVIEEVGYAAD